MLDYQISTVREKQLHAATFNDLIIFVSNERIMKYVQDYQTTDIFSHTAEKGENIA